jgi:hypothetical protein
VSPVTFVGCRAATPDVTARRHHVGVDAKNRLADAVDSLDHRAPGLVRFLAGFRWGGLRTVRPDRRAWAAVAAGGAAAGLLARAAVGVASGRDEHGRARWRPPLPAAVLGGQGLAWWSLWRWDTARWRRTRVALVLDLTAEDREAALARVRAEGFDAEPWERRDGAGTTVGGIVCRSRDLRAVNRLL